MKTSVSKKKNSNLKFGTIEVAVIALLTTVIGLVMGFAISKTTLNKTTGELLSNNLQNFINTYEYILENYYENLDEEKLLETGLEAMINSLDKYSEYYSKEEMENLSIKLNGQYQGIGVEIVSLEDGNILVYGVFKNSPAAKAGLEPGDIIKTIHDMDVKTKDISYVSDYMKNGSENTFKIIIDRNGEEKEITLKREKVVLETAQSKIYEKNDKKIGYIYVSLFASNTYLQFRTKLNELEKENIDSLILDLRGNGGGHLTSLQKMISEFLEPNTLIFKMKQKDSVIDYYSGGGSLKKYPLVILVDENTASASEVMAISLKQQYGATIIGKKTYGKGTVQELNDNSNTDNNYSFKITTMQWLAPDDTYINEVGIIPDIEVTLNEEFYNNPNDDTDNQLQSAINHLINK